MVQLAANAARTHGFDEKSLRLSLAEIARRSYGDGDTVNKALEEGWKQGVAHSMADGIVTQTKEAKLREFRDRLALADDGADHFISADYKLSWRNYGVSSTVLECGARPGLPI